ncbi:hypothetical protein AB0K89_04165 [Streptomyces cinnamoneus]|uniref:hypothetical protein n=1 Tax=Streptomyces cinnamoneus TaxID=53446 RepID=UPI0034225E99
MHLTSLPPVAWWAFSIAATAAFLAFFVPLMPSRDTKIKFCYGPAGMVALCLVFFLVFRDRIEQIHMVYCSALLAMMASFAGRRKMIKRAVLDQKTRGVQEEVKPTPGMWVQLALSLTAIPALAIWLSL